MGRKIEKYIGQIHAELQKPIALAKPIAEFVEKSELNPTGWLESPKHREQISQQCTAFCEQSVESWSNIQRMHDDIQRVLKMVSFERKPEDMFEPEKWIAPHKERTRSHERYADRDDYEEDEGDGDSGTSDDPGKG
jgi:hypothetical protein